jgi:hypothetical protein
MVFDVEGPEMVGGIGTSALDDELVFELDVDGAGVEDGGAAKLANGDE